MFRRILPQTVKARLLGFFSISFCLLIAATAFLTAFERKQTLLQGEELRLKTKFANATKSLNDQAEMATAVALAIAAIPSIQEAFAERDRSRLFELTQSFYQQQKEQLSIAQFQFHTPPAIAFLRLHQPEKFGDDLSSFRQTVVEANKDHKVVTGLEYGVGGFGIRGVVPVSWQKNHIGSVELGIKMDDHLLQLLKKTLAVELTIFIPEKGEFKSIAKTSEPPSFADSGTILSSVLKGGDLFLRQAKEKDEDLMLVYGPLKRLQRQSHWCPCRQLKYYRNHSSD